MKKPPKSKVFDDVYFSAQDGLAETRHVFLDGNNLPQAWTERDEFIVFETGFGTGLNFLSTWRLFEATAKREQALHFISVEKYPLECHEILDALKSFGFEEKLDTFLDQYALSSSRAESRSFDRFDIQDPSPSFKFSHFAQDDIEVKLSLYIGDANEVISALDNAVDCWFLDGFKPSTNPEMWTEMIFENMGRMSKVGATFATFTAAGFVRRGLQNAGFGVEKVPGFGTKREMLVGSKS